MKRYWQLIIVIIGTIGLLSYIIDDAFFSELTNPLGAVRLFKYFSILSNVIAVTYFWMMFSLRYQHKHRNFDHFIGAIAIYLFVTFVIYALLLEGTYEQSTLDWIGNISLHYLNPIFVVVYLVHFRQLYTFQMKDMILWFVFPVIYLVFLVLHGIFTGDYLYSFFQVSDVGIEGLISMIVILIGIFYLLSLAVVKIVSRK